jgi:hypothetical protein
MTQSKMSLGDQGGINPTLSFSHTTPSGFFSIVFTITPTRRQGFVVGIQNGKHKEQVLDLDIGPTMIGKSSMDKEGSVLFVGGNQVGNSDGRMGFGDLQGLKGLGKLVGIHRPLYKRVSLSSLNRVLPIPPPRIVNRIF